MAIIEQPPIVESPKQAERTLERKRQLEAPEIPLSQDLSNILYHPDEVAVSFDPTEKTAVQEALETGKFTLTEDEIMAYENNPPIQLKFGDVPYLQARQDVLDAKRDSLQKEAAAQQDRIQHLKDERLALLAFAAPGEAKASDEILSNPTAYMMSVLTGLSPHYVDRSYMKGDAVHGTVTQRFGLLAEEKLPREENGVLTPVPRGLDMDIALRFDAKDQLEAFQVTTDLEGKLDYYISLKLNKVSPKDEEGNPQIQITKHGLNSSRHEVEVTDAIDKQVFYQAILTNLYHGVYGHVPEDDKIAKDLITRRHRQWS